MTHSLRVYDPALCCSTGVCGTSVDPELARIAADLVWLKTQGVEVERFNLAHQPGAFVEPQVKSALERLGEAALPLILLDGSPIATGHYPTRAVLARLSGIRVAVPLPLPQAKAPCCGPKDGTGGGGTCS